jgi:glycosyltransferase involved in cell wall biosynthesis
MRLHYIANARMPSEKAHGIQIAKMCEAFIGQGIEVVLVVPSRGKSGQSAKEFYSLTQDIPTVTLPALDWYDRGRIGYALSTLSFIASSALYLLSNLKRGDSIYTVDLDHFSYALLPYFNTPLFCEMHGGKPDTSIHRRLFKKAKGIIPTNTITREQIKKVFGVPEEKFIVEPNGVDFSKFSPLPKEAAREKLNISQESKLVLYIGRFFDWKGLGILPEAVKLLPKNITLGLVGGSKEEFEKVAHTDATALTFYGSRAYAEMPLWEAAADVLLVLGTKVDEQSWNYTSPMKVFEYMAMKRPIVASRTPALKNILAENECYFYEPDHELDLARAIQEALVAESSRVELAYEKVTQYSWDLRAKRIISFIKDRAAL